MKTKLSIAAVMLLALTLGAVALVAVSPVQANHTCRNFTTTQRNVDDLLGYNEFFRFHYSPRLYSSNDPHCNRAVVVYSQGWHFEAAACGTMWVRMVSPNTGVVDGSQRTVCGGQTVTLLCCLSISAVIRVEGHRFEDTQRTRLDGWVARVRT